MGRLLKLAALLLLTAGAAQAASDVDFDLGLDLRLVDSSGGTSYLNGGLGLLRFDPAHDGLRLGQLRLGMRAPISDTISATVEATSWGDHDRNPVDLIEALVNWRPLPSSAWRPELRVGAFYAPISLENRMRGWRSPYTLSPSAINTWVGEELRTIGAEYDLDWLGTLQGHDFDIGLTAAVYGWNDPAGVILARRGWSVNDRQTTLFGRVGQPGQGRIDGRTLFYDDIDHRPGWYAGGSMKWRGLVELRALRYDNRGDPSKEMEAIDDYAWHTRFNSLGVRITPDAHWTFIWQGMRGITEVDLPTMTWYFDSQFLLASWQRGPHRLTARAERFSTDHAVTFYPVANSQDGHAFTAAWSWDVAPRTQLVLEQLWITSRLPLRVSTRQPVALSERTLQLALRVDL